MNQNAGSQSFQDRARTGAAASATGGTQSSSRASEPWKARQGEEAREARAREKTKANVSVGQSVLGFVLRNPLLASGAALAVGAAAVMFVSSRRVDSNRIDRRAMRAARSMERTFAKEMRALRHSDAADRVGRFGASIGDAFSRIDLAPLAERGRLYLEAARHRLGR